MISGMRSTGRRESETSPMMMTTNVTIQVKMGRLIENSESFIACLRAFLAAERGPGRALGQNEGRAVLEEMVAQGNDVACELAGSMISARSPSTMPTVAGWNTAFLPRGRPGNSPARPPVERARWWARCRAGLIGELDRALTNMPASRCRRRCRRRSRRGPRARSP